MSEQHMAREMTPHERAAALIEQMLVFIEKTSRRKLSFSAIVDMNTGKTENPQDRLVAAVMKHDTDTRRAALLEAAQVIPRNWLDPLLKGVRTSSCPEIEQLLQSIKAEIDRLAQEG